MIVGILQHTPIWVWVLFAMLVGLGLLQMREREISLARAQMVPLIFMGLSLSGLLRAAGHPALIAAAWAGGFASAFLGARHAVAVRGAFWSERTGRLHVPGSAVPLMLMVGLFLIKYTAAVAQALHPALMADTSIVIACNALYGVFSALFWARAYSLRRLGRPEPLASPRAAAST
jgi:hypothetical protein